MSAPIRPLPVEAAPQRTESDVTISSAQPNAGTPGFGEVLNLHLAKPTDGNGDDDSDPNEAADSKGQAVKKQMPEDASAWTILGVAFVQPHVVPPSAAVEHGSRLGDPQVLVDAPESNVADPRRGGIRAPSPPAENDSPPVQPNSPEIGPALKQVTPVPEAQNLTAEAVDKPEEIAGKPPETDQKVRGIPVAKQSPMPLAPEKQDLVSSQEPRSLFASVQSKAAATQEAAVSFRAATPATKTPVQLSEFAIERFTAQQDFTPTIRLETPSAPSETTQVADVRAAAVIDSIREHVQIVRISQQNELNVVLRPDQHTELSLQIRHVDGQIHLQARCERGDFTWLDSNWSAVQNTLAQQGVRVEPLQAAFRAQDGNSSMFMQDQRGSQQQPQRGTSPDFTFEQESTKPRNSSLRPSSSTVPVRGWQSWA